MKKKITLIGLGDGLVIVAALMFEAFRAFGYWDTDTSNSDYRKLNRNIQTLTHPRTTF